MAHIFADINSPRILLVKTSSLGDVLHNLPVVSDIVHYFKNAQIDWIVEESFAALPKLHPSVRRVIPVAVRRWRNQPFSASTWREISAFRRLISSQHYDVVIDTQGLFKSAMLMLGAQGIRCGFDRHSAREPLATFLYQRTFRVATGQHAIERNRQLVAQALGYRIEETANYGLCLPSMKRPDWFTHKTYAVLLHSTSRSDKLWQETHWIELGQYLQENHVLSILPWGNDAEYARSARLAKSIPGALTPPRLNLNEAALLLGKAKAVIGVDTGLAHLAAALDVPTIGIYTATDPSLTGLYAGKRAINLGSAGNTPSVSSVIEVLQRLAVC